MEFCVVCQKWKLWCFCSISYHCAHWLFLPLRTQVQTWASHCIHSFIFGQIFRIHWHKTLSHTLRYRICWYQVQIHICSHQGFQQQNELAQRYLERTVPATVVPAAAVGLIINRWLVWNDWQATLLAVAGGGSCNYCYHHPKFQCLEKLAKDVTCSCHLLFSSVSNLYIHWELLGRRQRWEAVAYPRGLFLMRILQTGGCGMTSKHSQRAVSKLWTIRILCCF